MAAVRRALVRHLEQVECIRLTISAEWWPVWDMKDATCVESGAGCQATVVGCAPFGAAPDCGISQVGASVADVQRGDEAAHSSQGEAVNSAQYLLAAWDPRYIRPVQIIGKGMDNDRTTQEVRTFQEAHGLVANGVVDADTWQALLVTVQLNDIGAAVMAVQSQLRSRGVPGPIDGQFTADLDAQVRDYQNRKGLAVDGQVGPQTWQALLSGA